MQTSEKLPNIHFCGKKKRKINQFEFASNGSRFLIDVLNVMMDTMVDEWQRNFTEAFSSTYLKKLYTSFFLPEPHVPAKALFLVTEHHHQLLADRSWLVLPQDAIYQCVFHWVSLVLPVFQPFLGVDALVSIRKNTMLWQLNAIFLQEEIKRRHTFENTAKGLLLAATMTSQEIILAINYFSKYPGKNAQLPIKKLLLDAFGLEMEIANCRDPFFEHGKSVYVGICTFLSFFFVS